MRVVSAESTELFVGPSDAPLQLVRVAVTGCTEPAPIRIHGDGLAGEAAARPGDDVIEVAVAVESPVVGERRTARVHTPDGPSLAFEFTVAEPGWTMFMISHFHYDPVWWNTQGAYTSQWREDPPGRARQANGFELVRAHLEMARREPEYKFVLAEVDYLKPYWDTHPQDRADLRRFLADGRIEVMGGTYNEPNTNLTSPETTIRNLVHGIGFQRDVLGAEPATAWQLDVFGHDPQFPGLAADAGLTSSSWARGPHHQWGPAQGGVDRMQFCSEFEWIAPSGRGLLTHYMPAHYSAGWSMDSSTSLADAEAATYALFDQLKKVALTRNVLLPVGTDYTPPNKWVTAIHRDWGARYTWPRFVCALPKEFFAAVRAELAKRGWVPSPQTRDMNPIYTGKDVSYIDTKQANRAAENAVLEAERFAVFAALLTGAEYPQAALAKAWVQLAYGAHHDAITGSESDQVYLDLLTGWRDAWELGRAARDNSLRLLSGAVAASHDRVVVWNPLTQRRTDIVTARVDPPLQAGVRVFDPDGAEVAALVEHDGRSVTWLACDVPSLGWRVYRLVPADEAPGWELVPGTDIANEHYRLAVDPERGGALSSLVQDGRQLIAAGRVANELALYEEYPSHPTQGEGPWHLLPTGPVVCSSACPAQVQAYRGPLGQRLVVRGRIGTLLRYTGQPGRCPADGRGGTGPIWPFGRSVGGLGQQPCGAHYRDGRRGLRRCDGRERAGCLAGVSGGRTGAARAGSGRQRGAGVVRSRRVGQCRRLQRVLPVEGGHRSVGQDIGGRMGRSRHSGERAGADGVSVRGDRVDVHRRSEGPGHPGGDARPDPVAPLRRTGRLRRRPDLSAQRRLELLHRPGDVSGRRVHRMLTSHGFSRAAVVGAGLMGRRIAGVLASAGLDVAITDTNAEILHAAAVEAARVAGAGRGSVAAAADLAAAIPDADLVIEAVVENLAVKQELFERLATLAPDAVLATNTSVLPIGAVTERVEDGSRVIGTHFWNPPDLIPVVEVVPSARTAPDTADRVVALLTQVGKLPVRVGRDVPGFIGNRLQHALWREAIALVAEGVCDPKTVDLVVRNTIGLRLATLGPLENADYIGLDLTLAIHDAVIPSLNHDPHPSPLLRELVAAGQLGARTGHGFLDWPAGAREATTARLAQHIAAQLQANEKGRGT